MIEHLKTAICCEILILFTSNICILLAGLITFTYLLYLLTNLLVTVKDHKNLKICKKLFCFEA